MCGGASSRFVKIMPTLGDIAQLLQLPAPPEPLRVLTGIANLDEAGPGDLSLLGGEAYIKAFAISKALAVIVSARLELPQGHGKVIFPVEDAELAVGQVLPLFSSPPQQPAPGVDALARVAASASIGVDPAIGPFVVIGERARIGARCKIHPGVVIGDDVTLGDDVQLYPNVVVRERNRLGHRVTLHANSVIGTDGFGYRWDGRKHVKIPQIGIVILEDDVELGSCSCVDRAKFNTTRVGPGTKVDNLVQIGHNVQIGAHCIITGQVGIAGSSKLGNGVVLGGQTAVRDHVNIGDGVRAAARSGIATDIAAGMTIGGIPAIHQRQHLREQAEVRRLPALAQTVKKLQEELRQLKKPAKK